MRLRVLCLAALAALLLSARPARAEVSVDFFYDALTPYGDWIDVEDYGYSWRPRDVDEAWRPYTVGEWAFTDAGWTWLSDEPFGWAVYHYGRWLRLGRVGWVWVPDTEWGPAWVSWRTSDRYVGWAPLPPESRRIVDVELGPWVDSYFDVGPAAYTFVETRRFGSPRLASVIVPPRENLTIIRETRNVTNVRVVNHVVINNGPDYGALARASERPVRKLRLEREEAAPSAAAAGNLKARVVGDSVKVAIPAARAAAAGDARPPRIARRVEASDIDRGWKSAGSPEQVAPLREKMKSEAQVPAGLPESAARRQSGTARSETATPSAPAQGTKPKASAAASAENSADAEPAKKPSNSKATAKGAKRGPSTPEPAPIGEAPRRRNTPAPSIERSTAQVPTPEPLRYREPQPDGADRAKHPPSATQPPATEPKAEPPRSVPGRDRVPPPRADDREARPPARSDAEPRAPGHRTNAVPPGASRRGLEAPSQPDRPAVPAARTALPSSKPEAPGEERKDERKRGGKEKKDDR